MKVKLLFLVFTLAIPICGYSQIRIAKLNTSGAAFGVVGLSFEKVQKKQYSWQIGLNYRPNFNGPSTLLDRSDEGFEFNEGKSTFMGLHLEYRFYTEKARKMETKPYFGLFTIAQAIQFESEHLGPLKTETNGAYPIEASWIRAGFGLEYGVQWIIKKRISIDWTILGFGLSWNQFESELFGDDDLNVGRFEDLLAGTPFIGNHLLFQRQEENYKAESTFIGIVPRAGIKLGLLF